MYRTHSVWRKGRQQIDAVSDISVVHAYIAAQIGVETRRDKHVDRTITEARLAHNERTVVGGTKWETFFCRVRGCELETHGVKSRSFCL